ncbi:MAG: hypothetical protein ACK5MZ_05930 [Aestuariibaculum sp.]
MKKFKIIIVLVTLFSLFTACTNQELNDDIITIKDIDTPLINSGVHD